MPLTRPGPGTVDRDRHPRRPRAASARRKGARCRDARPDSTNLFDAPGVHAQAARTILVFGDSLSAGYGIRQDDAWPALRRTVGGEAAAGRKSPEPAKKRIAG